MLYREWFVHFRFPGHEHVKIIDGIPEGWEAAPASNSREINPSTPRNNDDDILDVPMAAVSETAMTVDRHAFERLGNKSTNVRLSERRHVVVLRITPCLENGKTACVYCLARSDEVACGSTECIVLEANL